MNGRQHGLGNYTNEKGEMRSGEWVDGRRVPL